MQIIKPSYRIMPPAGVDAPEFTRRHAILMLKRLELIGRKAYKSEDKITENSFEKFVTNVCRTLKHESVMEHCGVTVDIVCDRGVSHEIVRHRLASYTQESTRYCVAGSMKLTVANPHVQLTVGQLYDNRVKSTNGAWKRMSIRQVDDSTGLLTFGKAAEVYMVGVKHTLRLRTRLGYTLEATDDHEVKTDTGYSAMADIRVGDLVAVNGTELLYQNKEWLSTQYNTLGKTATAIADEFGFSASTVKKWVGKHQLPKKADSYWNRGRKPWNSGLTEADPRVKAQADALRSNRWDGGHPMEQLPRHKRIKKLSKSTYHKVSKEVCAVCARPEGLEVHHIDENRENNDSSNHLVVCQSHHLRIHSKNLEVVYMDSVVSVEDAGFQDVFDISMAGEHKNFAANGVLVHNCNYSNGKFGNEITVIEPPFWEFGSPQYYTWLRACHEAEACYLSLMENGAKAQEARDVLPNSLKTEIAVTANLRQWGHIFKLRTAPNAHPQMREIMVPLANDFAALFPELFDKVEVAQ